MHSPEYDVLSAELARLGDGLHATNAFVFDAWGLVWCFARFPGIPLQKILFEQIRRILETLPVPLTRGGSVDRMYSDGEPIAYCRSFAATYVLILWLAGDVNELQLRREVRDSLPQIEQLTLALPKPPGGGPYSGALSKDRA